MSVTPSAPSAPSTEDKLKYTPQTVLSKTVWLKDKLFSVRISRHPAFQFMPGQFARLGLCVGATDDGAPNEWRAYSMVSTPDESALEFFSVVVPEGKFSPAMARLEPGDTIYVDNTPFGFLTLDRFPDGQDLWLISTGTGLSAYLSMLRLASTWRQFRRVVVVHGVRQLNELAYQEELLGPIRQLAAQAGSQLIYLPVPSREPLSGEVLAHLARPDLIAPARVTSLLQSGELEKRAGVDLDPAVSRIMLCGNPAMVTDMRAILGERQFAPGRRGVPGNLAVENYW